MDLNTGLTQVLSDGTNTYIYGNERLAQVNTGTEYFLGDALGSVRQLTNSNGAVTYASAYDPYGVTTQTHGASQTAYGYTNEYTDSYIKLIYLRSRMYDPYLNQFIQPDTIVPNPYIPADWNKYTYVRDNPINYTDPTGHDPWWCEGRPDYEQCYKNYLRIPPSVAPLTEAQWTLAKQQAKSFGLPPELVAGTIAVEIEYDTDWYDYYLDVYLQQLRLILHYTDPCHFSTVWIHDSADVFLSGYEHYFGLLGGRGPGNGVANVHILTAKQAEQYYTENYPGAPLLKSADDIYYRMAILETDRGNIRYTAAILRQLADLRKGTKGNHTNDLDDIDMEVIYSAFRADLAACYGDLSGFQAATGSPEKCFGPQIREYLDQYRKRALWEKN